MNCSFFFFSFNTIYINGGCLLQLKWLTNKLNVKVLRVKLMGRRLAQMSRRSASVNTEGETVPAYIISRGFRCGDSASDETVKPINNPVTPALPKVK